MLNICKTITLHLHEEGNLHLETRSFRMRIGILFGYTVVPCIYPALHFFLLFFFFYATKEFVDFSRRNKVNDKKQQEYQYLRNTTTYTNDSIVFRRRHSRHGRHLVNSQYKFSFLQFHNGTLCNPNIIMKYNLMLCL